MEISIYSLSFAYKKVKFQRFSVRKKLEFFGNVNLFCKNGIGNVRFHIISVLRNASVSDVALAGNGNVPFC